ncbi:MAG: acetylxylan esterase [Pirellulales bacterium]
MAANAAEEPTPLPPLNRFPRMVQEHFVDQLREFESQREHRRSTVKDAAAAERYVHEVRQRIRSAFGPEPERTPLNARVTRTISREAYRIENVIFESRPKFYVTGNLYLPAAQSAPAPAVVGVCGHSDNGKAAAAYQSFAQSLARLGFVVFLIDPMGQGERLQYVDADLRPRRGVGVAEHLYAGNQQFLVGEFFGAWRAWDGVRALDYLLSRPEVDAKRVGVTGNSGGGTLTTWLAGLDSRWTMAAPSCFVTSFRRNLENELPADTEQCPPRVLALGLDHGDFLAAMAPKPVIILAKERDFFDVRGAIETYEQLKPLWTLLGAPDNLSLFVGPTDHGYSIENRVAMYAWFRRASRMEGVVQEPTLTLETDLDLRCTQRGQVAELEGRNVFDFTREKAQALAASRGAIAGEQLKKTVVETLKLPVRTAAAPEYRILRPSGNRRYPTPHATTYAVETEPRVFALATRLHHEPHYSRPPQGPPRALLYVADQSSDLELRSSAWLKELIANESNAPLYACDVRGIGESRPDTCGTDNFAKPYGSDFFYAAHGLMLDRPYVGRKTHDVLRVLDWLAAAGHREVHVAAAGWGTLPATFASLLHSLVVQVSLKGELESYRSLAENEAYNWPLSAFVPNVLAHFDLPDCYAELKRSKRLQRSGEPAASDGRARASAT